MTTFAVYANDAFWGFFDGETEVEAIQAAADEHGTVDVGQTHASTEGMMARDVTGYPITAAHIRQAADNHGIPHAEFALEQAESQLGSEAMADARAELARIMG
jgi:hypothetical protein